MTRDEIKKLADYFTTSELVELLDVDTFELVTALHDYNEDIFSDAVLNELDEIMGVPE